MIKRWVVRLQPLFLLLATLWIGWLLRSQWQTLRNHQWQLQGGWFMLATLLILVSWGMEVGIWQRLLHLIGGWLPYRVALRIWFLSAIVRYIPGNVWQPLSMTLYCQRRGISPEATAASVMLYQLLTLLAVAPIALFYFPLSHNWGPLTPLLSQLPAWLVLLILLPIAFFLVRPRWLFAMINYLLGKVGRQPLATDLSARQFTLLLLAATLNWLLWGTAFAALTFALSDFSYAEMMRLGPQLMAVYVIAYAIGFLSLITPSGIGVREGALYLLLTPLMDGGIVTAAALAMRAWTTLGELVMAGLSALDEHRATVALPIPAPHNGAEPEPNRTGADLKRANA